jgi:hypothetical protein
MPGPQPGPRLTIRDANLLAKERARNPPKFEQVRGGASYPWAAQPNLVGRKLVSNVDKRLIWPGQFARNRDRVEMERTARRSMSNFPRNPPRELPPPAVKYRVTTGAMGEVHWVPHVSVSLDDLYNDLMKTSASAPDLGAKP